MADLNNNPSKLLTDSSEYRKNLLLKNSGLYTSENPYDVGHPNSISDGDEKGKDKVDNGSVGSKTDIDQRNKLLGKNTCLYTKENQYSAGHPNTISDGDYKGRDPEGIGGSIGTKLDIGKRELLLGKNAGRYTSENPYGDGNC